MLKTTRGLALAAALTVAVATSGCGGVDGVELNGGVFDALGVSTAAMQANKREAKVADRTGLVVPPDVNRLPTPGEREEKPAAIAAAWPNDPEEQKQKANADLRRRHAEFCEKALQREKVDPNTPMNGPLGNCAPSIFTALTGDGNFTTSQAGKPAAQ